MNKADIEKFAVWARQKLRREIENKAGALGISSEGIAEPLPQSAGNVQFFDIGTGSYATVEGMAIGQRGRLVQIIEEKAKSSGYKTAYDSIIEQTAYTWFNRLIAVRFMEVNRYLPDNVRVLSSENAAKLEPDIVSAPFDSDLRFTPREREMILQMKEENRLNELFRFLFIRRCNALSGPMPRLFEKTDDYTELLLNISFTDQDGVVYRLVHDIKEDDFNVKRMGQVQIIGWLYQYYNTELNELVYDGNMSKSRIPKELLPAATTIYTPDWSVRYMVENSLGRLWLEGHPDEELRGEWKYYLDEASQEPEAAAKLEAVRAQRRELDVREIKFIDPCMGSGHILVYAFDLLMRIYDRMGWTKRDAVRSIVENNLYGLDIDERATQLAYFSVMMKACEYDERFLTRSDVPPQPNIYVVTESNGISASAVEYFSDGRPELARGLQMVMEDMRDASEYGSILTPRSVDFDALYDRVDETYDEYSMERDEVWERILPMLRSAQLLSQKYEVVVTNPPYLGSARFSPALGYYVKKYYSDVKSDLSMVMYRKTLKELCMPNGYTAFITTSSWMFLSSFENVRKLIDNSAATINLVDYGTELFDGKVGHNPIVSWVTQNTKTDYTMTAIRLVDYCYSRRDEKEPEFFNARNRYTAKQSDFSKIPGSPVAYWLPQKMVELYAQGRTMESVAHPKVGMQTSNNDKYLRIWYEINYSEFLGSSLGLIWIKYLKGGAYRKWYGNLEYLLHYNGSPNYILQQKNARVLDLSFLTKKKCTWTDLTSGINSFRLAPDDTFYDISGHCFFPKKDDQYWLLAYSNTKIFSELKRVFNSTFHCQVGDVAKIAVPELADEEKYIITLIAKNCVNISKYDWDSFETSWDFRRHPLVRGMATVQEAYEAWAGECEERFRQLKTNEEEINRIFIDIYGLQNELTPEVEDRDVTVRRADLGRDIRSLVSYAVGCMFGRYSLDLPGLAFAGGDFDSVYKLEPDVLVTEHGNPILIGGLTIFSGTSYKKINIDGEWNPLSFEPDKDNCLPITDEEYFEDDIVAQFVKFVSVVFGEETLEENLDYIAKALGNRGSTSREAIRNYFLNDFYTDHLKIYQKRPIYWMFDSGKQNGFKALVYMHRWNADTIGNVRVEYLHKTQQVYERELERMQEVIDNSKVNREIAQAQRRRDKLTRQLKETRDYDQRLAHLALLRVDIDLDDGVKVNYDKVQTADGKNMEIMARIK